MEKEEQKREMLEQEERRVMLEEEMLEQEEKRVMLEQEMMRLRCEKYEKQKLFSVLKNPQKSENLNSELENKEKELEDLENLMRKQAELRKISPAEYDVVFADTKIQMDIRKSDLKNEINKINKIIETIRSEEKSYKKLKMEIEYIDEEMAELNEAIQVSEEKIAKFKK